LICLMRAFSAFRAATSFVCISSRFIRQILINCASIRFFSSSFSFCNFSAQRSRIYVEYSCYGFLTLC
jgi:hypothetical protein